MTVSVIRRLDDVDYLAKTLVVGGAVVALSPIFEARTGIQRLQPPLAASMPFLRDSGDVGGYQRAGTAKLRVFGSAQHPIALSAALVMLTPLALYLYRPLPPASLAVLRCAALAAACASTISRTGIVMFVVVGVVFLWLRPRETRRLWPALLVLPVAIHFALPGTLGAIKQSFLPAGGLVAEQHASANTAGSGRLADLGPGLAPLAAAAAARSGLRHTSRRPRAPAASSRTSSTTSGSARCIGTGAIGFFGWLWFFVRAVRRFGAEAKRDESERGWLLAAIAASVAAYAVGMVTFDAFAFIQVTFLLFILVGSRRGARGRASDAAPRSRAEHSRAWTGRPRSGTR